MLATMSAVRQLCVRALVPLDLERGQAFLGCAHMRGDDGHGIVEADHLKHILDGQRLAVVDALELAAEHRTNREGARPSCPAP